MDRYVRHYDSPLLDDLHNYFPAFLYDQQQFNSVPDIFRYMNQQIDRHFNLFNTAQREYTRANPRTPIMPIRTRRYTDAGTGVGLGPLFTTTRYADIAPLFTTASRMNDLESYLMSLLQAPPQNLQPVIVSPSQQEIDTATTLRAALAADEEQSCSICQDSYTEGQALRTISRCTHNFHKNCIDTWFERNVRCPVCRYDIRGT